MSRRSRATFLSILGVLSSSYFFDQIGICKNVEEVDLSAKAELQGIWTSGCLSEKKKSINIEFIDYNMIVNVENFADSFCKKSTFKIEKKYAFSVKPQVLEILPTDFENKNNNSYKNFEKLRILEGRSQNVNLLKKENRLNIGYRIENTILNFSETFGLEEIIDSELSSIEFKKILNSFRKNSNFKKSFEPAGVDLRQDTSGTGSTGGRHR